MWIQKQCSFDFVAAVQNERQPRNTAQIRHDQLETGMDPTLGGVHATVSATHPAFSPVNNHRFLTSIMASDNSGRVEQDAEGLYSFMAKILGYSHHFGNMN